MKKLNKSILGGMLCLLLFAGGCGLESAPPADVSSSNADKTLRSLLIWEVLGECDEWCEKITNKHLGDK